MYCCVPLSHDHEYRLLMVRNCHKRASGATTVRYLVPVGAYKTRIDLQRGMRDVGYFEG